MRVEAINNISRFPFSSNGEIKSDIKKRNANLMLVGGTILTGSALFFANYNRPKVIQKSATDLAKACKENFLEICRNSQKEDYVASTKNIKEGLFNKDLHSHTNHSDGWGNTCEILEQVATYADKVYEKTGKMFTFAITDHDDIGALKEAELFIRNNPDKFRHVNFVPGVELSFAFNSNGQVKSGELLAYFVNPKSESMKILVDNLRENRSKMIDNCVENLGKGFNRSDLDDYFLNKDGETFAYNLHYRLRNYAQIKNRVNKMATEWGTDNNALYHRLMRDYVFEKGRVPKPFVTPEGFDAYLKRTGVKTEIPVIDENINNICEEFFPKIIDGRVVSDTENSFEKIIDTLKDDENVVLGFAHPYFTAKQMADYKKEFDVLLNYANGRIQLSENFHQAYPSHISHDELNEINQYLTSKNLISIGGRDNHSGKFI